ncbi:MAG: hypothetical protein H6Q60_1125 [Oscillospiraceae bacterium]|nr:hypothetical protein [Oscillospiraceae bacterium]
MRTMMKLSLGDGFAAELGWMTLGSILIAVGDYFFKIPNHFSTGGVSGLSILLASLIPGLSSANLILIFNLLLLLIGFFALDQEFGLRTVYCTVLFSGIVQGLDLIFHLSAPLTSQPILELFFSVIFPAVGAGILFNVGASSGGTDIVALILKKFTSLDIGISLLCTDVLIAGASFLVFGIETGLFSLLGLCLKSVLVDTVIESLNRRKSFLIITTEPDISCSFITTVLHRGATKWQAEGVFSHTPHYIVLTAVNRHQAVTLRRYLKQQDPHAFLLITNSSEIFGKGFLRS